MKRRWSLAAVLVSLSLLMSACAAGSETKEEDKPKESVSESTGNQEKEPEEKGYEAKLDAVEPSAYGNVEGLNLEKGSSISVIGKSEGGEYWKAVKEGAEQAVADINDRLGYEGDDKVKLVYSGPAEANDVDEQVNILDEELARYPAAVCIAIVDAQACDVQFDLAADSGIPVVAFDSGSDYQGLMATVATDQAESAALVADKLAEAVGEAGEIAVFAGNSKAQSIRQRVQSFTARMEAEHPEVKAVSVYYMDQLEKMQKTLAEEKNLEAEEITQEDVIDHILEQHPNLKGCFAADGTAAGAVLDGLDRAGKSDLTVMAYDGSEEELEALESGKVNGLIVQNPFGMGYAAVVAAARASLELNNEAYVDTGYIWVTPENLDSAAVEQMLY